MTDVNLTVLCGTVAADPEIRTFDSGARVLRILVTVTADQPRRRVDVIPVTVWDPTDDQFLPAAGDRVWVAGSVQRRFVDLPSGSGRHSRIEVIADEISRAIEHEEMSR